MLTALTRTPSRALVNCELTHLSRQAIDVDRARVQHEGYRRTLERLGVRIENLPADEAHPDSVFVEDRAIVLPDVAVITRSAVESREGEAAAIAAALAAHREIVHLDEPATLDGGDVLTIGRVLYVGQSSRTNHAGLKALAHAVLEHGFRVKALQVRDALHLKSACTYLGRDTLLVNPAWIDRERWSGFELIEVDPREPSAANALAIGDHVVFSSAFPRTRERIEARGFTIEAVDVSELQKAEGALTCLSLVFESRVGA